MVIAPRLMTIYLAALLVNILHHFLRCKFHRAEIGLVAHVFVGDVVALTINKCSVFEVSVRQCRRKYKWRSLYVTYVSNDLYECSFQ